MELWRQRNKVVFEGVMLKPYKITQKGFNICYWLVEVRCWGSVSASICFYLAVFWNYSSDWLLYNGLYHWGAG